MNPEVKNDSISSLTWQMAITAVLLAICIGSQFMKNLSVYITGPVVNLCLIIAAMTVGLWWGLILAVITPVTAFLIAASPVMQAVPLVIPMIMLGNMILVVMTYRYFSPAFFAASEKVAVKPVIAAIAACVIKAAVMGLTISLWLLPSYIPAQSPLRGKLPVFQTMFSVTQLITALIGFVYFFIIWKPVKKISDRI